MAEAQIIDGRARAAVLRDQVAIEVGELARRPGVVPGLAVVLVGDDPASEIYVRAKGEQSRAIGMHSVIHRLGAEVDQATLETLVRSLNEDQGIDGILVQLPLPGHLDTSAVIAAIAPDKDVDGLGVVSAGLLATGQPALAPCTPLGCLILLEDTLGPLAGRHAVVIGRSILVGRPVAQLLLRADCTVTMAHSRTRDLATVCRQGDILVAAAGAPGLVRGDWIAPGACVIDVGVNRVPFRDPAKAAQGRTRVVGDVAFAEAVKVAGAITPVPGGVGPMTVACLLANTLAAAKRRRRLA